MLLTKDVVLTLKTVTQDENHDMEQYKSRGSGRYVPDSKKNYYIINVYVIHICNRLLNMLNKGNYSVDRVIGALQQQDWSKYSYSGKIFDMEYLRKLLGESKKTKITDILDRQTVYLRFASKIVIEYLEGI